MRSVAKVVNVKHTPVQECFANRTHKPSLKRLKSLGETPTIYNPIWQSDLDIEVISFKPPKNGEKK